MVIDLMLAYLKLFEFLQIFFYKSMLLNAGAPQVLSHESTEQMKTTEHECV
jgi:hypothetical protein